MEKNKPKSEKWATLTPCSSATVCRAKSWPDLRNSLALELQCGVNNIPLQCIPWPVACSEWGACLTPSKFGVLWANDPRMETFHKFMSKICVSTTIHVSRPNIVKIGHCEVAEKSSRIAYKKPGIVDTSEPPISPPFCRPRPKIHESCQALMLCICIDLVRISCGLPDLFRKESKKVSLQL